MRVTPLPAARTIAATALALATVAVHAVATPSSASAARWLRPLPGAVTRAFSYTRATPFVAGAHRGADFAGRPGDRVGAACGGRVVFAGAVAGSARVVTLRCGPWRVTHLPLRQLAVAAGTRVRNGALLGVLAPGHRGGLHLGVRRAGDPFGYEDPLGLLDAPRAPAPPVPAPRPRRSPPLRAPRPALPRRAPVPRSAQPRSAPASVPTVPGGARAPLPVPSPFGPVRSEPWRAEPAAAPPPLAWAGLALALAGAMGTGTIHVRRRRAAARARTARRAVSPT